MSRHAVDRQRTRRVAAGMDRQRAAATVERLRREADVLRKMFPANGPVPDHVSERIHEKRRVAAALEAVYGESWEAE